VEQDVLPLKYTRENPHKPVKTRDKACFVTGLCGFVPPLSQASGYARKLPKLTLFYCVPVCFGLFCPDAWLARTRGNWKPRKQFFLGGLKRIKADSL
jgi:hypothetical protein